MKTTLLLLAAVSLAFAQNDLEQGIQLHEARKSDEAKAVFENILKSDPNNAEANCRLGRLYAGHFRDPDKAIEYCSKAVKANGKNSDNDFGYFCLEMKRPDDAISQFEKYIEVEPQNPNAYDSLGDGYFAKQLYDDAISSYKKAVELNPEFTASLFNLGKTYEAKGLPNEALTFYSRCLAANPNGRYAKDAEKRIKKLKND